MATQAHLPADSSHLTTFSRDDMVEIYGGMVDARIAAKSVMRSFVPLDRLTGTDTKTVRRMGDTTLIGITDANAGTRPAANPRQFDRVQVTVDTIVLARDEFGLLNQIQSDVNMIREVAVDHGQHIAEFFDAALLSIGVKTALDADGFTSVKGAQAGRDLGEAIKGGTTNTLVAPGDEEDPDALYAAVRQVIVQMQEKNVDTDECAIFLRPTQYDALSENDKLISRDFVRANGDYADGTIMTVKGVPLIKTTMLSQTIHDLSILSDGSEYVPTAAELKCTALVFHPKTLLGVDALPLTSRIIDNKLELSTAIDSYIAFGAAPRRPDYTGAVFTA